MDTWLRNLSPQRKMGGWAGKQRQLGDRWNEQYWEKTERWSCGCWNDRVHLKRNTPVEKGLTWQYRLSWGTGIHIGVWEHHLGKVWNQHLTSKQLEYHNSKQNKGLACRISQNKHMIEISSEVFVVGPTWAQSYNTIMYKAVHMTYEVSPSQHSQGLFKTQRDHCKTGRG